MSSPKLGNGGWYQTQTGGKSRDTSKERRYKIRRYEKKHVRDCIALW